MLDGDAKAVYEALKKITGDDDVYKVVEAEEIMELLPYAMSKLQLSSAIRDLKDADYVRVKYFTPDEYCLITLKRNDTPVAVQYEDRKETAQESSAPEKNNVVTVKAGFGRAFFGAFLGAFLGASVVVALAIIITKFAL